MLLETDKSIIGSKIREYRKRKKLTQAQLAESVDLNEKQISRIESGQNLPTYVTFVKLVNVLDISIKDFILNSKTVSNPLQDEIVQIIKSANNSELKIYRDVLIALNKNFKQEQ